MQPILANVGVPMIFIHWPLMIGALIPVIVIEALLIRRWLPLSYGDAFKGCSAANAFSTFVGVPLAWLAMFALELVVMMPVAFAADNWHWKLDSPLFYVLGFLFSTAWLAPVGQDLHWMVPLAVALFLIPCFYASVRLERSTCRRMWPSLDPVAVSSAVYRANLASYVFLFLLACGWMIFALLTHQPTNGHGS